jgi:hypothetical protein
MRALPQCCALCTMHYLVRSDPAVAFGDALRA